MGAVMLHPTGAAQFGIEMLLRDDLFQQQTISRANGIVLAHIQRHAVERHLPQDILQGLLDMFVAEDFHLFQRHRNMAKRIDRLTIAIFNQEIHQLQFSDRLGLLAIFRFALQQPIGVISLGVELFLQVVVEKMKRIVLIFRGILGEVVAVYAVIITSRGKKTAR